ncbi:hypothetical protein YC2023_012153 [Brassica napus]
MIPPEVKITKATTNKSKDYAAFSSEGDLQEIRVLGSRLHQVTAPAPPICLRQRVWPPRIHMRMILTPAKGIKILYSPRAPSCTLFNIQKSNTKCRAKNTYNSKNLRECVGWGMTKDVVCYNKETKDVGLGMAIDVGIRVFCHLMNKVFRKCLFSGDKNEKWYQESGKHHGKSPRYINSIILFEKSVSYVSLSRLHI